MKLEKLIQDKGLTGTEAAVLEYIVANLDHVLRDGVRTREEFAAWLAAHPAGGIVTWMP